jgi:hypothetical protein
MKTSFLLLETIFSFFIMSMVILFSTLLFKNILTIQTKEFDEAIVRADLLSTQLFIAKQLKNGVVIETNQNQIRFYAIDYEAFLEGSYSGIIDLNASSATKVFTPLSQTTQLESHYLLFDTNQLHELIKSAENNFLYFKNSSAKTLYEHYKIIKGIFSIHFDNQALYFNHQLLQDNIQQFDITTHNHQININICMDTLCETWIF